MLKLVIGLCVLGAALAQITSNAKANAGASGWSALLKYEPNQGPSNVGYTRFVRIRQDAVKKQWRSLGSSFTIEFWFNWEKPTTGGPMGAWDPVASPAANETQFVPLVTRHPGMGFNNEWAAFHVQLTRTQNGASVVAWTGCGCAVPPAVNQPSLETCGFGYLLFSDHPSTLGGPLYIEPDRWYHVALTIDGDGSVSDAQKTRKANLFINGRLRRSNAWNDPANNPNRQGVCQGREIPYKLDAGFNDEVRLGYLDNQDHPTRTNALGQSLREFEVYGFDGKMDEVRLWVGPRSVQEIQENFDLSQRTLGSGDSLLMGYYNFNAGPVNGSTCFVNNTVGVNHTPLAEFVDSANSPGCLFAFNTSEPGYLTINGRMTVKGKRPESLAIVPHVFQLPGFFGKPAGIPNNMPPVNASQFEDFIFTITGISSALNNAIARGDVLIVRQSDNSNVDSTTIPNLVISNNDRLSMTAHCRDASCTNLKDSNELNPRAYFLEYQARATLIGAQTTPPATLYFNFVPDCRGNFDACGVCNGHNETCQCVVYHNFRNTRMAHILLQFMMDYIDSKIDATTTLMKETAALLQQPNFRPDTIGGQLDAQVADLMKFFNGCLNDYCQRVSAFNDLLRPFVSKKRELAESDDAAFSVPANLQHLVSA